MLFFRKNSTWQISLIRLDAIISVDILLYRKYLKTKALRYIKIKVVVVKIFLFSFSREAKKIKVARVYNEDKKKKNLHAKTIR